ncbi:ATP-binding protein [Tessaracoccus sp. OS52]|uniref:ATP-binding protein n=1 Tax=Tessaracoccus sp. OS52 TaxID=2886691 RepID=UPI001D0F9E8F|nr:ATP-binding protein [Tessaracoccus sp. OS52]
MKIEGEAVPDFLDRVLDALETLLEEDPPGSVEDRSLFALALSEITTNVIEHSAPADAVQVTVELCASPVALQATVSDTAPPVSLDLGSTTMPGADLESGRGLALARAVLSDFSHEARTAGNVWHLRREL